MLRSTSTNYMIQKDDVGKAKPSTRTLPHPDWSMGNLDPQMKKVSADVNIEQIT